MTPTEDIVRETGRPGDPSRALVAEVLRSQEDQYAFGDFVFAQLDAGVLIFWRDGRRKRTVADGGVKFFTFWIVW
jgi:hypothetical protein